MFDPNYSFSCVERFLRYVTIDTQSDENAECFPTTEKQKNLSRLLVDELLALGIADAHMDENGYVMATIPSNTDKVVPAIGFISHVDTSPAVSGENVQAVIRKNYQGGDIVLENDGQVIRAEDNPDLSTMIGFDIITTDGSTLLGADNKAGVAEIMDAAKYLLSHPEVKHGPIKICFTPDEEVGRGTEKFDVEKFGAKYAYTVDGQTRGEVEMETFSADAMHFTFKGKNIHPGYAKGKMINSLRIAAEFITKLPKDALCPEATDGREGYVHCNAFNGSEEETTLKFIIRSFETSELKTFEKMLSDLAEQTVAMYPGARLEYKVFEQYRNMYEVLKNHPQVGDYAIQAMERLAIKPKLSPIRGGTDGARLSFMGLPTPNIFAGEHSFHAKTEWVAIQDMEMAVRVIVEIAKVWEENS